MALAGNVKRSNFLTTVGIAVVVMGLAGGAWWQSGADERAAAEEAERQAEAERIAIEEAIVAEAIALDAEAEAEAAAAAQARAAAAAEQAARFAGMQPHGVALMTGWHGKDLGSPKRKDVSKGQRYKINVYQDAGNATANRAKVDLDRDDAWDEKWTFEPNGGVTRKVAPNDDENYSVEQRWVDGAWQ